MAYRPSFSFLVIEEDPCCPLFILAFHQEFVKDTLVFREHHSLSNRKRRNTGWITVPPVTIILPKVIDM